MPTDSKPARASQRRTTRDERPRSRRPRSAAVVSSQMQRDYALSELV